MAAPIEVAGSNAPAPRPRLARWSRLLLALTGVLFVFTGLAFFVLPEYGAANFPWNVTPFVAMTIGGWALGMGLMAMAAFRGWSIGVFGAPLVAVWSFSILQLLVAVAFLPVLRTDRILTWPYLAGIVSGLASAALGLPWLWANRAELRGGSGMPRAARLVFVVFPLVTAALGLVALLVVPTGGSVFPEPLSAFTTRAFAAFFFSLALGSLPIVFGDRIELAIAYSRTGLYLLAPITVAAFVFLHVFDFAAKPGQLIYIGAYLLAIVVALYLLFAFREEARAVARWRP